MGHLVVSEATDSTHQRKKDKMLKALLLLGLVAAAHAGLFIQDGQEYEYRSIVTATAGTMDVATHSTVNVYSFLRVWVSTDNTFVQVMPAPSTRGQHCGLCGTFNRNVYDEWMGKDGQTMVSSADAMVNEWK